MKKRVQHAGYLRVTTTPMAPEELAALKVGFEDRIAPEIEAALDKLPDEWPETEIRKLLAEVRAALKEVNSSDGRHIAAAAYMLGFYCAHGNVAQKLKHRPRGTDKGGRPRKPDDEVTPEAIKKRHKREANRQK